MNFLCFARDGEREARTMVTESKVAESARQHESRAVATTVDCKVMDGLRNRNHSVAPQCGSATNSVEIARGKHVP